MNRLRSFASACYLTCTVVIASPPNDIAGTVIDSESGKPVLHARVTALNGPNQDRREALVVLTGEDGRFRFTGLTQGDWEVRASKPGYQTEPGNRWISPPSASLTMRLTPLGGLPTRVVDPSGAAIEGAQITFVRRVGDGWKYANNLGVDYATGDGQRRLLPRGSYLVIAVSAGTGNLLRARGQTFVPTYYPGTTDILRAVGVEVIPSKEVDVKVPVVPIPGREIRGRLGFDGNLGQISVTSADNDDYRVDRALVDVSRETGEFRISGLAPGNYVVNAGICLSTEGCNPGGITFRKSIQISDADIDNLVILMADRLPNR